MSDETHLDDLQRLLGESLRDADPVPPELHRAALSAHAFVDLDAAVAELVAQEAASAVRDHGPAPLVFAADALEIALEVDGGRCRGQLAPAGPWPGRVESPGAPVREFQADELGRFALDVPGGPIRVVVAGPDGPVRTEWFLA